MIVGMKKELSTGFSSDELLARLRSSDRDEAWKQFLEIYSPLIMHIASLYEFHRDSLDDCYLFICEKLSDNNFSRLLSYLPQGPASFRSWLNVVVANLCIDWRRHKQGRMRPFKSISKLSFFDQLVFKYRFQQSVGLQTCMASMQIDFPDVTESQLASAVSRINEALSPRQHWLLSTRKAQTISLNDLNAESAAGEPIAPGHNPEQATTLGQEQEKLQQALSRLSPRQRLLIKLRYQQELSLKEVARLTRLGDPFRARRHLQAALAELAEYFHS
jgi:RNA polymerase sigma factor (sigma-70 family)